MKSIKLVPFILATATASVGYADLVEWSEMGGSGDYTTRVTLPKNTDTTSYKLVLTSAETTKQGAMYKTVGGTVAMIDSSAPATNGYDIQGDLAIDINSAEKGDVYAINNANNILMWNISTVTIKNSQNNADTYAVLDLGKKMSMRVNTSASQTSKLVIETNTKMSGAELLFNDSNQGGFYVNAGIDVVSTIANINVRDGNNFILGEGASMSTASIRMGKDTNSASGSNKMTLNKNSTLIASGAVDLYGTELFIDEGAYLETNGIALRSGTKTTVKGELNYTGTSLRTVYDITVDGGTYKVLNMKDDNSLAVRLALRNSTLFTNNAEVHVKGGIWFAETAIINDASVKLYDYDADATGRVVLSKSAILTLNSKDIFTRYDSSMKEHLGWADFELNGTGSIVYVNATNHFGSLKVAGNMNVTFSLSDDANVVLSFDSFDDSSTGRLIIENYSENRVFVANESEFPTSLKVSAITADGTTYSESDLFFVAGIFEGVNGFWLNTTAVPEPAEWAAIFGALALGLAMYRRRK